MDLTAVKLYSDSVAGIGQEIGTFSLANLGEESHYLVRQITGIDAEEIISKYYATGTVTKTKYYDIGMKAREVVLRIVLNPHFILGQTASDLRDHLYRSISATRTGQVMLHFYSGTTVVARISGTISKLESGYFSKLPEVQLTISCSDPVFRAINPVVYTNATLGHTNPIILTDGLSTAPHGFTFSILFSATTSSFTIQEKASSPDWKFKITPVSNFLTGDRLYFSSEFSNKFLYMTRGGVTTHLIDRIDPTASVWPILFPGGNSLHFVNLASFSWLDLRYYAAYWGV